MNEIVELLTKYGYWLLFATLIGRQACLPLPGNLLLLAAGALAGFGRLNFVEIVAFSVVALMLADLAWYVAARRWGSRTLHLMCGAAEDPTSCVNRITAIFERHGAKSLLFSKFIIGMDAVAAPMAGISGVGLPAFLLFDGGGALLWSFSYAILGYLFKNQLGQVAHYSAQLGTLIVLGVIAGAGVFIVRKLIRWYRFYREFKVARITPEELWHELIAGKPVLVLDLQDGGKRGPGLAAIPGAVRIDSHHLLQYRRQYRDSDLPTDREVVLYCDSPNEATSARVALELHRRGFERVRPLSGGIRAWRKCGFPVSFNVPQLPLREHAVFVLPEVSQYSRTSTAELLRTSDANLDLLLTPARQCIGRPENQGGPCSTAMTSETAPVRLPATVTVSREAANAPE
jgi:membrane protein DedA with SNARE-associated domain/rhodanese-related sulfurtransferase